MLPSIEYKNTFDCRMFYQAIQTAPFSGKQELVGVDEGVREGGRAPSQRKLKIRQSDRHTDNEPFDIAP